MKEVFTYTNGYKLDKLGEELAKEKGIEISMPGRVRLMSNEKPVSSEEIAEIKNDENIGILLDMMGAYPLWSPKARIYMFDEKSHLRQKYYLSKDENGKYNGIRWDRIHGKHRKILKYEIKKSNKRIDKQFNTWNKYVGRDDVLCIHAKMGSSNWKYYGGDEIAKKPWFLEKVDEYCDARYCHIYAKIDK